MARISDIFAGRSLEAVLKRARHKMMSADFDEATRVVCMGLEKFPDAEALRELQLTIRRIQARSGMQELKKRNALEQDPLAFEQLITLYQEVDMLDESKKTADEYAAAHPERDNPNLTLGEMYLQAFFDDLLARDAHAAHDHLLRAGQLNTQALKPRLLLAELYYCVGANRALSGVGRALERIDSNDDALNPVLETIVAVADPNASESMDGLFAQIEVEGELDRDPSTWPLRNRRNREAQVREERTQKAVATLVREGVVDDIVVLRKNETPLVVASLDRKADDGLGGNRRPTTVRVDEEEIDDESLSGVVRSVARTISQQAREFDLGAFKRCSIEGKFGLLIVGRASNVIVGAHRPRTREPLRLWERLSVTLDGASRRSVS